MIEKQYWTMLPEWIRSGYTATRIVDAPSLELERNEADRWNQ